MAAKYMKTLVMTYQKGSISKDEIDTAKKDLAKAGLYLVAVPCKNSGESFHRFESHGVYSDQEIIDGGLVDL
jgi:ABC-type uncharacterized transport system substrate-binding protein